MNIDVLPIGADDVKTLRDLSMRTFSETFRMSTLTKSSTPILIPRWRKQRYKRS